VGVGTGATVGKGTLWRKRVVGGGFGGAGFIRDSKNDFPALFRRGKVVPGKDKERVGRENRRRALS